MVKAEFTLKRVPVNGALKDRCGLPLSCVFQPFGVHPQLAAGSDTGAGAASPPARLDDSALVARCGHCYSYVNCFCSFQQYGWVCSLCGKHNDYRALTGMRYNIPDAQRNMLPELRADAFEAAVYASAAADDVYGGGGGAHVAAAGGPAVPIYVALLDVCGGDDCLELCRSAVLAALEALPPTALFGLATFSNTIGLHDVKGGGGGGGGLATRLVPIFDKQPPPLPLADAMPLLSWLAPVGQYKDAIAAAVELIQPDRSCEDAAAAAAGDGAAAPTAVAGMQRNGGGVQTGRGFGAALEALMEYLQGANGAVSRALAATASGSSSGTYPDTSSAGTDSSSSSGALPLAVHTPIRLMAILTGPPDLGPGKLRTRRQGGRGGAALRPPVPPSQQQQQQQQQQQGSSGGDEAAAGTQQAAPAAAAAPAEGLFIDDEDRYVEGLNPRSRQFYEQAAVAAAALHVTVDLYLLGPRTVGLKVLQPLVDATGGAAYLYPSPEECALPQDVYRRLAAQYASDCLLRVRTCPGLRVSRHYGRLYADPQYDSLYHATACCPSDTFALDLDYTSADGFAAGQGAPPPTLQFAFQYTCIVAVGGASAAASGGGVGSGLTPPRGGGSKGEAEPPADSQQPGAATVRLVTQRRLRVVTLRLAVATTPLDVYTHANADAVVCVLMHKILRAAKAEGLPGARLLLRDWLVILTTNHHSVCNPNSSPAQLAQLPVDLSFGGADAALGRVPCLIYALMRSPLLAAPAPGQHGDLVPFLEHLWSCLPPSELVRAVYPVLCSFADTDTPLSDCLPLSRATLAPASGATPGGNHRLFLLDAYIAIIVLYSHAAQLQVGPSPPLPFPPPPSSLLRRVLADIRQERRITPQVRLLRQGVDDTSLLEQLLLDDPEPLAPDAGAAPPLGQQQQQQQYGLPHFLQYIADEVVLNLQQAAS